MDQEIISQTALDQMTGSDYGQMMKAAIPYLPPESQKILSIYAKSKELMNTIALFSGHGKSHEMCAAEVQTQDPLEIINDIRRFCYGESRHKLDQMVNMMAVVQMMQLMGQKGE